MQSSGSIGLCLVWQTRPLCIASYAISVRQTGSLPVSALHCLHIRLPSDSTSRWTPLPSANSSYCQVCSGLSPPSYCPCRAHEQKALPRRPRHRSVFHRQAIAFRAADQRRPKPFCDPARRARHATFCGTAGRSSGFSPWTSGPRLRAPTPAQGSRLPGGKGAFPCGG